MNGGDLVADHTGQLMTKRSVRESSNRYRPALTLGRLATVAWDLPVAVLLAVDLFVGVWLLVVLVGLSKLGEMALNRGWFWVFLVLSIVVGGLFLIVREAAT